MVEFSLTNKFVCISWICQFLWSHRWGLNLQSLQYWPLFLKYHKQIACAFKLFQYCTNFFNPFHFSLIEIGVKGNGNLSILHMKDGQEPNKTSLCLKNFSLAVANHFVLHSMPQFDRLCKVYKILFIICTGKYTGYFCLFSY